MRKLFIAATIMFSLMSYAYAGNVDRSVMDRVMKETTMIEPIRLSSEYQEELICLALNIYHESRNSTLNDKLGTGFVPLERLKARPHKTLCGIVWEIRWSKDNKKWVAQFSWTLDGRTDIPYEEGPWIESQLLAVAVFYHETLNVENPVPGATYYVKSDIMNEISWTKDMDVIGVVGAHSYMVEK